MSRLGKKGITIPEKTEVSFDNGFMSVKGAKGTIERTFKPNIIIKIEGDHVSLVPVKENKQNLALWGTYASHIRNMVTGVNSGFEKKLILEGVGFKSEVKGDKLVLDIGFSHLVNVPIPVGLTVKAERNLITISGADKELVGFFTAKVRSLKKPEPYKGKGFRYEGEVIRRKQGKKST